MLTFDRLSFWEKRSVLEGIDALIVGSGIVGMTTAIHLKKKDPKKKIVILERGYLPSGASTKNAGFACFGSPTEILDDLGRMEEAKVWDTVAMRFEGLKTLFELVDPSAIHYTACGSWDLLTNEDSSITEDHLHYLNQNIEQITGHSEAYSTDQDVLKNSAIQGFSRAYKNRLEGALDTGNLMDSLHALCTQLGIRFIFSAEVLGIESQGENPSVYTQYGSIKAQQVAVCTNGFASRLLDLPVLPARAQVLVTDPIPNLKIRGTFHFEKGYYYFRNIGDRLLLGGARNKDFQGETTMDLMVTEDIQNHLLDRLKTNILPNQSFTIGYQWAGIMGVGEDKHPIITQTSPNVFAAVRMGGMGVAIGSLVGLKLSNLMINGK